MTDLVTDGAQIVANKIIAGGKIAAPSEVVEFDLASYTIDLPTGSTGRPTSIIIHADGSVRETLSSTGSGSNIGTWLQGGGAPADASIYEVEMVTTTGTLSTGGFPSMDAASTDVPLNTAQNGPQFGLRTGATAGIETYTGTISIKLIAGSVVQDTALVSISANGDA